MAIVYYRCRTEELRWHNCLLYWLEHPMAVAVTRACLSSLLSHCSVSKVSKSQWPKEKFHFGERGGENIGLEICHRKGGSDECPPLLRGLSFHSVFKTWQLKWETGEIHRYKIQLQARYFEFYNTQVAPRRVEYELEFAKLPKYKLVLICLSWKTGSNLVYHLPLILPTFHVFPVKSRAQSLVLCYVKGCSCRLWEATVF